MALRLNYSPVSSALACSSSKASDQVGRPARGSPWVACVGLAEAERYAAPWRDLCARALSPNAFAEPAFVLALARRLAPRGLQFLFVWRDEERSALIGALALIPSRWPRRIAEVWRSEQAALPALALDRDLANEAMAALLGWLSAKRRSTLGLLIPLQERESAGLVETVARQERLAFSTTDPLRRAVLRLKAADLDAVLSGKRLKEWRRLRRRLEERGALVSRATDDPNELREAGDAFLALEARGWKGRSGAPLNGDPQRAAFARDMLSTMAEEGKLRIDTLSLDGALVAAGLLLVSAGRAFYWKTAYDEAFAVYSPGALLTLDLSRRAQETLAATEIDSCAIENHPMIDRLWPDRLALVDCAVALRADAGGRVKRALALRRLTKSGKETAKRLLFPLLGRKRS
jgi:CelD/BcsL family acetyltransferase involved in cellulose biosynthesis